MIFRFDGVEESEYEFDDEEDDDDEEDSYDE